MIVTLCTERIRTLDDIRAFLGGNEAADITPHDREAAYAFIERALVRFRYHLGLSRAGKGRVREFLAKVTGYSDSQLSRLIAQQRRTGRIRDRGCRRNCRLNVDQPRPLKVRPSRLISRPRKPFLTASNPHRVPALDRLIHRVRAQR